MMKFVEFKVKYFVFVLSFFIEFNAVNAQDNYGINFEDTLSWDNIIHKANLENKSIFLDCYASWCGPCKKMDKEIYPLKTIGDFYNKNFICVRMQMDTTKEDAAWIKARYDAAHSVSKDYSVQVYPTYLFFSNGKLVHRAAGGFNESAFINLANDALNPGKQYYTLLRAYDKKKISIDLLPQLIKQTNTLGNKELANKMADYYFKNLDPAQLNDNNNVQMLKYFSKVKNAKILANKYLKTVSFDSIFLPKNISIIAAVTSSTSDGTFGFLYEQREIIDNIMKSKDYVESVVCNVLKNEVVNPLAWPNGKISKIAPDWIRIQSRISKKYIYEIAERTILSSKVTWYQEKREWDKYTESVVLLVQKYGKEWPLFTKNNLSWSIFQLSDNKEQLEIASTWVNPDIIKNYTYPNSMDTYANLLYKLGKVDDAMKWQERAINLSPNDAGLRDVLNKMKKGTPTWPLNP